MNRSGGWQFHGWQKIANMDCHYNLVQIAKTPIKRHVKIRGAATPFAPNTKITWQRGNRKSKVVTHGWSLL